MLPNNQMERENRVDSKRTFCALWCHIHLP